MSSILNQIVMDTQKIQQIIPHRYPLLLIDTVHQYVIGEQLTASKMLIEEDPVFQGHFPNDPIYPGVYYIEGIAQSGAVLAFLSVQAQKNIEPKFGVLASVEEARFRRPGRPGDRICYEVQVEKTRGPFYWFKGSAYIEGEIVAECKLSIALNADKGSNS
jgi:3-hydroxyacyl-[acyl-carrier-protein] dehydratase